MNKKESRPSVTSEVVPIVILILLITIVVLVGGLEQVYFDPSPIDLSVEFKKEWIVLDISALIVSISIGYITVFRPYFRRPRLHIYADEPRWSPASLEYDVGSWFIRLKIQNWGKTLANSCFGRLIELYGGEGTLIKKYEPLSLFWARQDKGTGHSPVKIQGFGDYEFLDVIQIKRNWELPVKFRIALPKHMVLSRGDDNSVSPGSEPHLVSGTYYLLIGIYAEGVNIKPTWFKIEVKEEITDGPDNPPCSIQKIKDPKFGS